MQKRKAIFYLIGVEVFVRMSSLGFPYELAKYGVCLFIVLALVHSREKVQSSNSILFYFGALLPSLLVVEAESFNELRRALSFNLSGPLTLALSFYYFYRRKYTREQVKTFFAFLLAPIVLTVAALTIKTPALASITFKTDANFETSGGFGPNQVSTILGLGIIIYIVLFFSQQKLIKNKLLNLSTLGILIFRGLLTFSRGGILAPMLLFVALTLYFIIYFRQKSRVSPKMLIFGMVGLLFFFAFWLIVNDLTRGKLQERYLWSTEELQKRDYLTGRQEIIYFDFLTFLHNPILGVGPGMSKTKRMDIGMSQTIAAHTEFSRILSEHGLLGVIALAILFYWIAQALLTKKSQFLATVSYGCTIFALFTMGHSAMRLACVGILFGFAHIKLVQKEITLQPGKAS